MLLTTALIQYIDRFLLYTRIYTDEEQHILLVLTP